MAIAMLLTDTIAAYYWAHFHSSRAIILCRQCRVLSC